MSKRRSLILPLKEETMKETVLDVLMYLFESFVDGGEEPDPNRSD